MNRIMFVCLGNICRSTMAEFVMKDIVRQHGHAEDWVIGSAATSREAIGMDTHSETKRMLEMHNIPFTPRKAVQLQSSDYEKYDYIIGMDRANINNIIKICGDPEGKVRLLLSFAGENESIADPWYTGDFERTFKDVVRGCTALYNKIINI